MPAVLTQPVIDAQAHNTATGQKPRVLMLTHRLPYPPDRGDRIRSYHLLKHLSHHFDMGIAAVSQEHAWLQHHQLLSTMAKRVDILPISPTASKLRGGLAFLTGKAVTPASHYRPALAQTIAQWREQWPYDAVLTFCTGMIDLGRLAAKPIAGRPVRHVLDLVDVDSQKWARYAQQSLPPMKWVYAAEARRLRRIEAGSQDHFDAVTVISEAEAAAYREHVGDHPNLRVVSNGVDLDYFLPLPDCDAPTLVFVGVLNYRPNVEGVTWFARHIMPKLRQRLAGATLKIVGRHPTPKVLDLDTIDGVEIVGSVPDVRVHLESAGAVIAPLLLARGVQNKVLEAMACGRAVVCSSAAAEGIDATDGEHLLVGRDEEQWVEHLIRVLTDAETRNRIAAAARVRVEERYSWASCVQPMVELLRPI